MLYAKGEHRYSHVICSDNRFYPRQNDSKELGLVRGNVVRARHVGIDTIAATRNYLGGEILEYSEMMSQARDHAIDKMLVQAEEVEADAVISVRLSTSVVMSGASEILGLWHSRSLG